MPKYLIVILVLSNFRECFGAVLRGARAKDGKFPWLIQFHTIAPCGGVLVSPDWVLTAAQCVEIHRNSIELYATGLNGTGTSQTLGVKATYMFPQYQSYAKFRDHDHNIALIKLVRSFDMCDTRVRLLDIAPVRLDDDYKSCLIFGWGSTVTPKSLKVHAKPVQYSKVLLNSWRVCMYLHEGNASYKNVFCTMIEDEHGIRACAGNPGSPVVCEDQYQRMVLLGIASWSNFSLDCGGLPTYLGVSVFRSWMWDLIFGNKNLEQWEIGYESGAGACQRDRQLGGLYAESNLHLRVQNNTDLAIYSGKGKNSRDDDYAWKYSGIDDPGKGSTGQLPGTARIPELPGKLEPPNFDSHDGHDDYTRILGAEGSRRASNFDVVREREIQLDQYREIGRNRDGNEDDAVAVSSQRESKRTIVVGKPARRFDQTENEIFDELELIMPDGIDAFDRSNASVLYAITQLFYIFFSLSWVIFL